MIRFQRTINATAALAAVLVTSPVEAQSAKAVLDHAVSAWANVKSLSGTFEQTLENTLLHTTGVAHGTYSQQRPNKLAVRFTDPGGDAIVSDGKFLWVYLKQSAPDKVIKRPASDRDDVPIDISQFLDNAAARFDITRTGAESVNGRPAQVLSLTPKSGTRAAFTHATVWVDDADGLVRQFEVVENANLTRRIRLQTLNVNPTLGASEFTFTIPKGVKVVTP
jgi:outer membrane lipoprotein carrier protein